MTSKQDVGLKVGYAIGLLGCLIFVVGTMLPLYALHLEGTDSSGRSVSSVLEKSARDSFFEGPDSVASASWLYGGAAVIMGVGVIGLVRSRSIRVAFMFAGGIAAWVMTFVGMLIASTASGFERRSGFVAMIGGLVLASIGGLICSFDATRS